MWEGVEGADLLVINAHKWLGAPFDCSVYYVRDPEHLMRVMSTNPSFLQSSVDGQVKNLRDWGIPLGRRFRALKLWFIIREQGVSGLQKRLRRDMANARWLAEEVAATPGWRVVAPVPLQTVCVRHEPEGLEGEALDAHTTAWVEAVNRSGAAYLTPAVLDGRWMARVSIGALATEQADVAAVWAAMREAAEGKRIAPVLFAAAGSNRLREIDATPAAGSSASLESEPRRYDQLLACCPTLNSRNLPKAQPSRRASCISSSNYDTKGGSRLKYMIEYSYPKYQAHLLQQNFANHDALLTSFRQVEARYRLECARVRDRSRRTMDMCWSTADDPKVVASFVGKFVFWT